MLLSLVDTLVFILKPEFRKTAPVLVELTAGGTIGVAFRGGGSSNIPTWWDVGVEVICTIEGGWQN